MVVIAWLGQGHAESGHQVRSGFVFNLAASSISRKESSWGQGVMTSPAQVISSLVEAELTLRSSVWNDKTQFGALYERMKAEKLHQHQRAGVILQSDGRISILLHEGHWKPSSRHKIRPTAGQKPCFRQHILSTVIHIKKSSRVQLQVGVFLSAFLEKKFMFGCSMIDSDFIRHAVQSHPKICRINRLPLQDWWRRLLQQRQSADLPTCFLLLRLMMKSTWLAGKAEASS